MGTRRLTLLRHGQAQSIDACVEDYERTLTHRGMIEAQEMAARIVRRNLAPNLLLSVPRNAPGRRPKSSQLRANSMPSKCNALANCT